jgi:hypothetical protein
LSRPSPRQNPRRRTIAGVPHIDRIVVALIIVLTSCAACRPSEPITVTTIQLGRSLNPDNTIASHTTVFKPNETVYVSALSPEPGFGTVGARWMYAGRLVDEPEKEVSYKGAAATEFHLQSAGGFPPGDYSVEIFVNGASAGKRTFRVDE